MAMSVLLRNSLKLKISSLNKLPNYCLSSIAVNRFSSKPLEAKIDAKNVRSDVRLSPYLHLNSCVRTISTSAPKLSAHGNHTTLWKVERVLSVLLLGIIPTAIIFPNNVLDTLMAITIVAHSHWGLEACVVDYVRPIIFGNVVPTLAKGLLTLISMITLAGLLYFNYNDIGISRAIRGLWSIKGHSSDN